MFTIDQEFVLLPLRRLVGTDHYQSIGLICDAPSILTKRTYPYAEVKGACGDLVERIKADTVLGTLDSQPDLAIPLDRVSHSIHEINVATNGMVYVTINPLKTPLGIVLKTLLEANIDLYYQMAATGKVDDKGVVTDLEILTFNIGTNRNGHGATL